MAKASKPGMFDGSPAVISPEARSRTIIGLALEAGKGYDPQAYPLKRMARPEEIAATAVFLCGAGSGYATGAIFDVNGGTHFH